MGVWGHYDARQLKKPRQVGSFAPSRPAEARSVLLGFLCPDARRFATLSTRFALVKEVPVDEKTIKAQLLAVQEELRRNEEERGVLDSLIAGYRGWLKLRAFGGSGPASTPPPGIASRITPTTVSANAPERGPRKGQRSVAKGTISMRQAVRQAILEADGQPIHVSKILERATELGARTTGKEPKGVVDLMAYSLAKSNPVEKVGPRLWRWAGDTT